MKTTNIIQTKRHLLVDVPVQHQKEEGCVAFQLVELTYVFCGRRMVETFDTKILKNGKQLVINGNGIIKDGFIINP